MAKNTLPRQLTPFIGRSDEIAELCELLSNSDCRLITLVGPGGIGKTRLAIEVIGRYTAIPTDGVCFVRLQPVQSVDQILPTVADALDFTFSGPQNPRLQLLNHLRDKSMFVILDNLEHLLDDVDFIPDMLAAAPGLKLVVTSREVLNLREEWLYPVKGLQYPASNQIENLEVYSAVQMFATYARRIRPDFTLENQQPAILDLCRLVEGMPLALELAATWARALSVAVIVEQILASIDMLTTSQQNMPMRHQSIRAVFDYSWELLSEAERSIFCSLSVFRGGFTAVAAMQVGSVSLQNLAALIDKSLVKVEEDNRYDLHELLRQYAAEKLDQTPEIKEKVLDQHCTYYTELLHQQEKTIHLHSQTEILKELDNLRLAWKRAVQQRNLPALQWAASSLHWIYHLQGWHDEGAAMFYLAEDALREMPVTDDGRFLLGMMWLFRCFYRPDQTRLSNYPPIDIIAALALWEGLEERPEMGLPLTRAMLRLLGSISDPQQVILIAQKSLAFSQGHNDLSGMAVALATLAAVFYEALGQFARSQSFLEEALSIDRHSGFDMNARWSESILGSIAFIQGQYEAARMHLGTSVAYCHAGGIKRSLDTSLFSVGMAALEMDDDAAAQSYFAECIMVASNHQRQLWISGGQAGLGIVAALQGDIDTAASYYKVSHDNFRAATIYTEMPNYYPEMEGLGLLALLLGHHQHALAHYKALLARYEKAGYRVPLMCGYCRVGLTLLGLGDEAAAETHLFGALREATAMGAYQALLEALLGIAQLSVVPRVVAVELLTLVYENPASNRYSRFQSARLLAQMEASFTQADFADAVERGRALTPAAAAALIEALYNEHAAELTTNQPLIDPLSQREHAVLTLVAAGLTNQEIAEELYIGISTVKKHINHIYNKLDVTHRAQAIAQARALKILP